MSNATLLAVRVCPDKYDRHLPPSPAIAHGSTAWPDGEESAQAAIRIPNDNPNHHLWNNNGTWWCHYTLHRRDFTKWRVRTSLATRDLAEARRLRDALLNAANRNGRA